MDVHQAAAVAFEVRLVRKSFRPAVLPVVQENVILVALVGVEEAVWTTGADDNAILDRPGFRRIGVLSFRTQKHFPASEVLAVKEIGKAFILFVFGGGYRSELDGTRQQGHQR